MQRLVVAIVMGFVVLLPTLGWLSWVLKDYAPPIVGHLIAFVVAGGVVALILRMLEKKSDPAAPVGTPPQARSSSSRDDSTFHAALAVLRQPRPPRANAASFFTLSLLLFVAFGMTSGQRSLASLLALVIVLLVHELGHAAAMRMFGYRDLRVFFVPFFGAVTTGTKRSVSVWQQCVVLLAGPVPGLVAGLMLRLLLPLHEQPWLATLSQLLIAVNVFNLLPLEPLDGGRIAGLLVLGSLPRLRVVLSMILALASLAFVRLPVAFALFMLVSLVVSQVVRWQAASAAIELRKASDCTWQEQPNDLLLAEEEVLFQIYAQCRPSAPTYETEPQYRNRVQRTAALMRATYEILQVRAVPLQVAVPSGMVFVAMMVLMATAAGSNQTAKATTLTPTDSRKAVRRLDEGMEQHCVAACLAMDQDPACKSVCSCQRKEIQSRSTPDQRVNELQRQSHFSKEYVEVLQQSSAACGSELYDRRFMRSCVTRCGSVSPGCFARCQCILETLRGNVDAVTSSLWLARNVDVVPPTREGQARVQEASARCAQVGVTPAAPSAVPGSGVPPSH